MGEQRPSSNRVTALYEPNDCRLVRDSRTRVVTERYSE